MNVMFVSECRGKAFKTTKKILNLVAKAEGERSWVAEMTPKGLEAVHMQLASSATKGTAVKCLVAGEEGRQRKWIVGDRSVFGPDGEYPLTRAPERHVVPDGKTWEKLPLVSSLAAVAALLHDIGKLNDRFQKKLKGKGMIGDPVRHEYFSCMILRAFVEQTGAKVDREWLQLLPSISLKETCDRIADRIDISENLAEPENPFLDMEGYPVFLSLCWLILSHHRLPYHKGDVRTGIDLSKAVDWKTLCYYTEGEAGYRNGVDPKDAATALDECRSFPKVFESTAWRKALTRYSNKLISQVDLHPDLFAKPDFLLLEYAKMSLVYGDHTFSAKDCRGEKDGPYANTVKENGRPVMNQSLEEHLRGVCSEAVSFACRLPQLAGLDKADDIEWLARRSSGRFAWQEKAAEKISEIRKETPEGGVFIVNMAGTGSGKTLANAKMLYALDGEGLRGTVALGLRTLTLQTGNEYRERMGIFENDLCIAMGSREAVELKEEDREKTDEDDVSEPLIDYELVNGRFSETFPKRDDGLVSKFLGSPVLVCTMDQIIKAIEATSGGKGIIPEARMMSSDLVIDEVDDYTGDSLVSIGRLVYLAATKGRNVIISSATIPPEISLNLKHYYDEGYSEYARWHHRPDVTTGLAVDEYGSEIFRDRDEYIGFCFRHVRKILGSPMHRKGEIVRIRTSEDSRGSMDAFNEAIYNEIHVMHRRHAIERDGKGVSFGLVRFANISQLVNFALYLGEKEDKRIKPIIYHSRFPLAYRHSIEEYLDRVLYRKNPEEIFNDPVIAAHLAKAEKDVVFVVLASPVEELGRDHDFDWGIVEPSSWRSIIQTAGRILRHRLVVPESPNVGILQFNAYYMKTGLSPCFQRPGFESEDNLLPSHDLFNLCDGKSLMEGITSTPRVLPREKVSEPLAVLEHEVTQQWLDPLSVRPSRVSGYINGHFLTAIPVKEARLRDSRAGARMIYRHGVNGGMEFFDYREPEKNNVISGSQGIVFFNGFKEPSWWLKMDHDEIVGRLSGKMGLSRERFENRYCIIDIPDNSDPTNPRRRNFMFHPVLGLFD